MDINVIKAERELVVQNIGNLEAQVNNLTAMLQQAQGNLLASRGAVAGFDRLLQLASEKAPSTPPAETAPPAESTPVAVETKG